MIFKILSYPRAIFNMIFAFFWMLFWSSLATLGSLITKSKAWPDFIFKNWSKGFLYGLNVKLNVEGVENLPQESGIILFTHSSHLDIPIVCASIPNKSIRFGAKAELFKIPIFSRAMRNLGTLEIHRAKREKVLNLYKESLKNLEHGLNYVLAPEGTRQDGKELGPFKSGPFIMAISGQCPLIPVVISGASSILPKGHILPGWGRWKHHVSVKILPSISAKGYTIDQRLELQNLTRDEMVKAFSPTT